MFETHKVTNQPPEFDYNLYHTDLALQSAVAQFGGNAESKSLTDYGEIAQHNLLNHSALANRNKPQLRSFDRFGHRINEVSFHPSYHKIMSDAIAAGLPSSCLLYTSPSPRDS